MRVLLTVVCLLLLAAPCHAEEKPADAVDLAIELQVWAWDQGIAEPDVLDFSALFILPDDIGPDGDVPGIYDEAMSEFLFEYIEESNTSLTEEQVTEVVDLLTQTEDPLRYAAIAKYESTFRVSARGAAGERGLVQIHPCHKGSMRKCGLDFGSEVDRIAFAEQLFASRGWQPWSVRKRATREYARLQDEFYGPS